MGRLLFILFLFIWGYTLIMLVCSFHKKRPSKEEKMKSFKEELEEYSKKKEINKHMGIIGIIGLVLLVAFIGIMVCEFRNAVEIPSTEPFLHDDYDPKKDPNNKVIVHEC